jgi:hypothetical protein
VRDWARPQVFQRLADLAGGLGNVSLAKQLDAAALRVSKRIATPARTGVGTRIRIPSVLAGQPRGSGSAWVDAQARRAKAYDAYHNTTLDSVVGDTFHPTRSRFAISSEASKNLRGGKISIQLHGRSWCIWSL